LNSVLCYIVLIHSPIYPPVHNEYEADDFPVPADLENYVLSSAFDEECAIALKSCAEFPNPDRNSPEFPHGSPVAPTVEPSPHDPSPLEARNYYYGVSDGGMNGPRLVLRTSQDTWSPTIGPDTRPRIMRLCEVPEDHQLAQNPHLWDPIRNQVCGCLALQRGRFLTLAFVF
jgi:hypothetical protein